MRTLKILFIITVIALSFYFFSDNTADPDLFGHLKFGEDIYENKEVPLYDAYSYSSPGARWINHEWLSELIFYIVYKFSGSTGLLTLKLFIGLIIALLISLSVSESVKSLFLRLLLIMLPLSVISYGFATRPQIFTYLFFTIVIFLLNRSERTGDLKWLYSFPIIFLAWSNLHGGFTAGIAILSIFFLVKIFSGKNIKGLLLIVFLSTAATFLNPNGPELWKFLLNTLTGARPYLPEWGRVTFTSHFVDYFAVVIIAFFALLFSKQKKDIYEITVLILALVISFLHNRHVVLFAVLFSLYAPKYVESFIGGRFAALEKKLSPAAQSAILTAFSAIFFYGAFFAGKEDPFRIEVPEERYPVNAVKFMKDNRISGNIFCFFDWAQMCIKELSGQVKVFFDGRYRTVYSEDLIRNYFEVLYGERDHNEYLGRFPETDIMLLHPDNPLARKLSNDKGWIAVYASPASEIFLKDNKKNKNILKAHAKGKLVYESLKGPFYLDQRYE
jgi:hypothetical protein